METTRRFWATVSLAAVLLVGAWVLDEPLLLVGTAGIGGSLVAEQWLFVRGVTRLSDDLIVTQTVSQEETTVGSDVDVHLDAALPSPTPFSLSIRASPPIAATGSTVEERTLTIDAGEKRGEMDFPLRWPVAGEFRFSQPRVSVWDSLGTFETDFSLGTTPSVRVEPRYPKDLYVGIRGERATSSLGEQDTGARSVGFDPAEIREYVPGDTMRHIDWKATARMGSLYVRELEERTDLSNVLLVDHRASMGTGEPGRRKLDYLRQVALGFVANGRATSTPCGLYGIGEGGITVRRSPTATKRHFDRLGTDLHGLSPATVDEPADRRTSRSESDFERRPEFDEPELGSIRRPSPTDVRTATRRLDSGTAFDSTLRPFFETQSPTVPLPGEQPLYDAVRTQLLNTQESAVAVFLTDDGHRSELQEAVAIARQRYEQVVVFLTPSVLFEPTGLTDLSRAYERYVDFEEFRKTLAGTGDVAAYEVGPQDRLQTILSMPRAQRTRGGNR